MKKYLGAIAGVLFFVGVIAVATTMNDGEIDFFADSETDYVRSYYNNNYYMPSMNITADTLRNWTGNYWNFSMYNNYNLYVRNATVTMQYSGSRDYYATVNFVFDAQGNSTWSNYSLSSAYYLTSSAYVYGPNSNVWVYSTSNSSDLNMAPTTEFLRYYCGYVVQPRLDALFYSNQTQNSSSNSSNSSNWTNSSNASNQSWYPDPIYGPTNLTVRLPSQNVTTSNLSIYVYNATFYGNSTGSKEFRGRIYGKFEARALVSDGWYNYTAWFYDQDIIYDVWNSYSANEYFNYSLIPTHNSTLQNTLFSYYWSYAQPAIVSAISNSSNSSNSTNATQTLPYALVKGENLTNWYNTSWWTFSNYTLFNYSVSIWTANFTGGIRNNSVTGTIRLGFDAFGNNSYTPPYNQSQTWEYNVGATIELSNSWVSSITLDRQTAIYPSDLRTFLKAWVVYNVVPYLLSSNSSNTTLQFPERYITGYDLNNWTGAYNAYPNYTWPGYYVYVYNFTPSLYKSGNDVYGSVDLSFAAYGNDTNSSWWYNYTNQTTTVWSNATIYVNGVTNNYSLPSIYVDWNLRVYYGDVQNFLRGYFYGIMVPIISSYYNLTTPNTTNTTIWLPNYYNNTQVNIDCSNSPWYYCSGASPQSYLYFLNPVAYNMSITVNSRGNGYFNGKLQLPYTANLINFTNTYYGKETIISNVQGNATLSLWGSVSGTGNNSYYVNLDNYAYAEVIFDRNNFVKNAAQQVYSDRFQWNLQYFINSILSNGTNATRWY